ncbi:hypothetical protein D9V32_15595 [Mycetocola tolaasinivorans]|uniref:Uncharacterized protein n=1 Tax=Mycetocola tolaasinivorans TaxID=76635 RepID=A0A3L6ZWC5_9MICO|nr:hypothetical protein [Mycetocola tolaasinivorans]RLP72316.1 hypothetical protein D9V32_15595 [Mycetocola tolaasinivorans]
MSKGERLRVVEVPLFDLAPRLTVEERARQIYEAAPARSAFSRKPIPFDAAWPGTRTITRAWDQAWKEHEGDTTP